MFLFFKHKAYDVAAAFPSVGMTYRAERRLITERAHATASWGAGVYLIECGTDMVFA